MSIGCLLGVLEVSGVSGRCPDSVWKVSGGCLEGVCRVGLSELYLLGVLWMSKCL